MNVRIHISFCVLESWDIEDSRIQRGDMELEKIQISSLLIVIILVALPTLAHSYSSSEIINNITVTASTGGNTATPGGSITTGSENASVFVETIIEGETVTSTTEIRTDGSQIHTPGTVERVIRVMSLDNGYENEVRESRVRSQSWTNTWISSFFNYVFSFFSK